jgi:hypothetical protein
MTAPAVKDRAFALPLRQCDACNEYRSDCEATVKECSVKRLSIGTVCRECREKNSWELASSRHRGR